jgi:3-oxoacyl-[acyl-carrier-protein] synthase II
MSKKRVVITGIGLVTPLGIGKGSKIFQHLISGRNGIKQIPAESKLVPNGCPVSVVATVPVEELAKYEKINEREMSKFIHYALIASNLALEDSGMLSSIASHYDPSRCGICLGNGGIGSLIDIVNSNGSLQQSYKKLSPYFVPKILQNLAAGQVSIRHNLKGLVHCVTTACAAGAHSVGDAYNFIRLGYTDMMLAGSTDSNIDSLTIAGFARMKALSTSSDINASRPFDKDRNGFVLGEGCGILVLEELESARKRNANIIAEVVGYGLSADASHTTLPSLDGSGAMTSMSTALNDAGITMNDISYINAHATSTPKGDDIEVNAITELIKRDQEKAKEKTEKEIKMNKLYVSSTKSSTGHLLGGAGSVETAFTALSLLYDIVPQTLHLHNIDPALQSDKKLFNHVPGKSLQYETSKPFEEELDTVAGLKPVKKNTGYNYALKNSFGFGGTNGSLVLKRYIG